MTQILEKNLQAMEGWYPQFVKLVEKWKSENEKTEGLIVIEDEVSRDGEKIYRIQKEGRKLYLNGKRNAKGTVANWQKSLGEIHRYAPVFLVGLGSGLYFKNICREVDETVNLIVYEPSPEIFLHTLTTVDLSEHLKKRMVAWVVEGINEKELEPVLGKLVSLSTVGFFKAEVHPGYRELFSRETLQALKLAGRVTTDVFIGENTKLGFAAYLARNQIQNMRYVIDGYNTLGLAKALGRGYPAVLVSAGPSLNKNIKDLKEAQDRAFILAVDTALKPLLKEGIIPDAFATIDSKKPLTLVEAEEVGDIPVIAPVTANSELLKRQRNKKIFYYDGYSLPLMAYAFVGKAMPDVSSGGSVACSGFSLLYKMGFTTVILVGQDLAYTDQKSHADGTFEEVMPIEDTKGMRMVKGNYEKKVPTRTDFKKYIDWFDMYIKGAKEHVENFRVINATEGGAFIQGTELMTLKEAIGEVCGEKRDFKGAIAGMESDFTEKDKERIEEYLFGISKEFTDIIRDAKKLKAVYKRVGNLSKAKNMNALDYVKQLKKIKKLTKSCESKTAYELISSSMPVAEYIVKSESLEESGSIEEQAKKVAEQGIKYAGFIGECATLLQGYMQEAFADFKVFSK